MKLLVKPIAILLLGAYSFALGQDVYPYFSDSKKQFKFEKKRIYIKEIDEKEQVISGGSTFNFVSLIDDSQPMTIPAPIRTTYNYKYEFHILQNGKNITEVEFLRLIGLQEEAEEILYDFSNKIAIWENTPSTAVYQRQKKRLGTGIGYILLIFGVYHFLKPIECQRGEEDCHSTKGGGIISVFLGVLCISLSKEKIAFIKPPKPDLEQTLSNEQIKSLAESYNKKIYEEIKNSK